MAQIFKCKETTIINNCKIEYYTWNHQFEGDKNINALIDNYLIDDNWSKFITKGSNTIDIGAHSGDTIIPLYIAGSDYGTLKTKVLAIEPNPIVREICELNAKSNISTNVEIEVVSFAITDKDDIKVLLFDHGNEMCNGGIIHNGFSEELKNKLKQLETAKLKSVKQNKKLSIKKIPLESALQYSLDMEEKYNNTFGFNDNDDLISENNSVEGNFAVNL